MKHVVISDLGVVAAIGIGKGAFSENLQDGVSGATTLGNATCCNLFGHHEFGAKVVCEVAGVNPSMNHVPSAYQSKDPFVQFACATTHQAFHDVHMHASVRDRTRAGITLAAAIYGARALNEEKRI